LAAARYVGICPGARPAGGGAGRFSARA
jgi:hypothetical protein